MSLRYDLTVSALQTAGARPIHAGNDYPWEVTALLNGTAIDFTSATIWLTVKESSAQQDADAKLQLSSADADQIEITDATAGEFTVKFAATGSKSTQGLEGQWWYDVKTKLNDGSIMTLCYGKIDFLPLFTRATS